MTPEETNSVQWALNTFNAPPRWDGVHGPALRNSTRAGAFRDLDHYYRGKHRLRFATEKFANTFGPVFQAACENMCAVVVDVIADRLIIEQFETADGNDTVEPLTREIWRANRMDEWAGRIHSGVLTLGEYFAVVWPNSEGQPVVYPNHPAGIVVEEDPEKHGHIVKAAKIWQQAKRIRLNIFYPDRIEKYITASDVMGVPTEAISFIHCEENGEPWPLKNDYGRVPVFRFANNGGQSELESVIPLQDMLNKSLIDMLVAMEYESFAQRWATGLEVGEDDEGNPQAPFKAGVDRVWAVRSEVTKFGEFSRSDLKAFIGVSDSLRESIARVSGIPMHYITSAAGGFPSGESLKTSEHRLTTKVRDRQISFGNAWADIMRFSLRVATGADVDIQTGWVDTSPRMTSAELWSTALQQQQSGVSVHQTLRERGYTDSQIEVMNAEMDALVMSETSGILPNAKA